MANIAVINIAGAEYIVRPGDKLEVNRLAQKAGESITPEVLLSTDGEKVLFGEGKIEAKISEEIKGEKLYIIKFKAKSRYRRRNGHRQHLSLIEVTSVNGEKATAKVAKVSKQEEVLEEVKEPKKVVKKASPKTSVKKATKSVAKKGEKK
jgi:large subunit ribosomal protein L21